MSTNIKTWQERLDSDPERRDKDRRMGPPDFLAMCLHAEISDLRAALIAHPANGAQADHDEAVRLLGAIFDAWENGDDCYEDGNPDNSYMGKCFKLDDDIFQDACKLLNRLNPPRNIGAQAGDATKDNADRYLFLKSVGFEHGKPRHAGVNPVFKVEFTTSDYGWNAGESEIDKAIDSERAILAAAKKGGA